jgi:putative addiction module antidote
LCGGDGLKGAIMFKVKVTAVGDSMGIALPKEVLSKLNVGKDDALYLLESAEGFMLTLYQQDFESQMKAADKVLKKYHNAFQELAK